MKNDYLLPTKALKLPELRTDPQMKRNKKPANDYMTAFHKPKKLSEELLGRSKQRGATLNLDNFGKGFNLQAIIQNKF